MIAELKYDELYKSLILEHYALNNKNDEESIELKAMLSELIDMLERNPELRIGLENCDSIDSEKLNKLEADNEEIQKKLFNFIIKIKGKYGRVF